MARLLDRRKRLDSKADIGWLHLVWEELISTPVPLKGIEIAVLTGIPTKSIQKVMNTLSCHKIPVYQEGRQPTRYKALEYVSHEEMDELLRDKR